MRIMTILGTRPEAIKMAPLIKELKNRIEIETIVCVTAQHREMLDQVLNAFHIVPDYDLDMILVHGDTTSTFVGALAGYYNHIKVGHVEAGLRTWNKYSPWPEEVNRQLVGCIADIHFAPTIKSKENLLREGKSINDIVVTGNTAIDALKTTVKDSYEHEILNWVGLDKMILLTAHRRENLGEPMRNMFRAIRKIVLEFDDVKVVYPVHLNPKVREIADEVLSDCDRIKLIEPLEVVDFHNFLSKSHLILTDSGGIQEEAPSLGKPVLVLRETTERPEGVEAGTLKLVGTSEITIYENTKELLIDDGEYQKMSIASNPYGDGTASIKIVDSILNRYINI